MHAAVRYMSLAVAGLVAASVSVAAQTNGARSHTTGLVLGLHLNGSSIKAEDASNESGAGIGGRIGYGFSPRLTAFVGYDRASIESAPSDAALAEEYTLGQLDFGMQYNFANNDRAWRPFVEAAATRRAMSAEVDFGGTMSDVSMYGYGMSIGAGFQYFLSAPWAISTGLNYTFGSFTKGEMDGQSADLDPAINARGARVNIGVSWHPMAGR